MPQVFDMPQFHSVSGLPQSRCPLAALEHISLARAGIARYNATAKRVAMMVGDPTVLTPEQAVLFWPNTPT